MKPPAQLIESIRELTRDDLAVLAEPRGAVPAKPIARIRDPHHRLARLIASGLKQSDAAQTAGYSVARVHLLMKDPTFQNLVQHYRELINEAFIESQEEFYSLLQSNAMKAERHIAERIEQAEEEGELLPIREALAVSRDAADRIGYGKKQTNVNLNLDFAARLERASRRSATVIDHPAVHNPPGHAKLAGGSQPPAAHQPLLEVKRRA